LIRLDSEENLNLEKEETSSVFEEFATGTVCMIASSEVAVVDVCMDDVQVKAKLLRENIDQNCRDIREVISVGDRLCMLLRSSYVAHSAIRWLVVKASKGNPNPKQLAEQLLAVERAVVVKTENGNSSVTPQDSPSAVPTSSGTEERGLVNGDSVCATPKTENHASVQNNSTPAKTGNVPVRDSKSGEKEKAPSNGDAVGIKTEIQVVDEFASRATTLKPVTISPIKRRGDAWTETISNCSGTLCRSGPHYIANVNVPRIRVLVSPSTFYVNGFLHSHLISRHVGTEINLDVRIRRKKIHSTGATHISVLSWKGNKPAARTVLKRQLAPPSRDFQLQPNTVYCGLVMEVPLLDCCIVKFGSVPVLVPAKSLFVDPWTQDTSPVVVCDYLKFGDHVALTCKIDGNCVVAEICGTLPSHDSLFGAVGTFNKTSLSVAKNNVSVSSQEAVRRLCSVLTCLPLYLKERNAHRGIITSFPFRSHAIATVGEIRVLVPVNSVYIVNENRKAKDTDCITELLTVGSTVLLWVEGKVDGRNSYYLAKEVRVILENSVKSKVVVKNYPGALESSGNKERYVVRLRDVERRIESDTHLFRLLHRGRSDGPNAMHIIRPKIYSNVVVLVNASINKDDETLHSVWLR